MIRVFGVVVACLSFVAAADVSISAVDSTSDSEKSFCHNLFRVPISNLSLEDRNYTIKDVFENNTVCVCQLRPCFLKCCPEGFSSSENETRTCVPDKIPFSLSNYNGGPYPNDYSLLTGFPCEQSYWDTDYQSLLPDGSLSTSIGVLPPGQFCLEYSQKEKMHVPLCCFNDEEVDDTDQRYAVYPFGMLVSIPFLLATLVVYAIIPDLRNTLHGMSFMCHIACLIIGYSDLAAIQLHAPFSSDLSLSTCITLAMHQPNVSYTLAYFTTMCEKFYIDPPWEIYSDGSIFAEEEVVENKYYCLELNNSKLAAYGCFNNLDSVVVNSDIKNEIYPAGMIISLPFFLMNIVVYSLIHELRRTDHGKAFIFLQASMLISYSLLAYFDIYVYQTYTLCVILEKETPNMTKINVNPNVYKCCSPTNISSPICPGIDNVVEFANALFNLTAELHPNVSFSWSYFETKCEKFALEPPWEINNDGSIFGEEEVVENKYYCLEWNNSKLAAYGCFNDLDSVVVNSDIQNAVYPVGMFISLPFFFMNIVVYSLIHELRRTAHGKAFIFLQASMFISYSLLAYFDIYINQSFTLCAILGYIMQFAFLATFFWMNVMCFDIWWTFSSLKKPGGSVRERDLKKFLLYSVYAWGCPLLILTATLVADFTPLLSIHNKFKPQMGIEKCFFKTAASTWLYMYGPIAVLIVANLIMFGFTAKKIFLHTRETQVLKSEDSKRHDSKDRERFNLYLKLFIVMGVNWVAELVSWTFNSQSNIWYITDITNTLQGLIIFIIFVCKPRVLRLLEAAVCPGRAEKRRNAINSSSRSRNTTTSVINGSARVVHSPETIKLKTPAADDSDSNM